MRPPGSLLLPVLFLAALLTPVSASSGLVQIWAHPGGGMICVAGQCTSDTGTVSGIGSAQFFVTCGMDHSVVDYYTPGYQSYHDSLYMDYNCDTVTRDIYLVPDTAAPTAPAPPAGTLRVFVSPYPDSGLICLDGGRCQGCTATDGGDASSPSGTWSVEWPAVSTDRTHTVSVRDMTGFMDAEQQVSMTPGGITTVAISLEPDPDGTPGSADGMADTGLPAAAGEQPPAGSAPAAKPAVSPPGPGTAVLSVVAAGGFIAARKRSR